MLLRASGCSAKQQHLSQESAIHDCAYGDENYAGNYYHSRPSPHFVSDHRYTKSNRPEPHEPFSGRVDLGALASSSFSKRTARVGTHRIVDDGSSDEGNEHPDYYR